MTDEQPRDPGPPPVTPQPVPATPTESPFPPPDMEPGQKGLDGPPGIERDG